MTDQEIATMLLEKCSYRMSQIEKEICLAMEKVATDDTIPGLFVSTEDRRAFEGLKTQFASELK